MSVLTISNNAAHDDSYEPFGSRSNGFHIPPISTHMQAPPISYNTSHLQLDNVDLYDAMEILSNSLSLETVQFDNVLYDSTPRLPSMRTERCKLRQLQSFAMLGGECHFMDLISHFVFPSIRNLTLICSAKMQSNPSGKLLTHDGVPCPTDAFQNFLLGSSSFLQNFTLQDTSEESIDLHLPQVLEFLARKRGGVALWHLKSLHLPLVLDISTSVADEQFLDELAVQLRSSWVKNNPRIIQNERNSSRNDRSLPRGRENRPVLPSMPKPRHITICIESDAMMNVPPYGCPSRRRHQSAPDGSGYIVACPRCPEKKIAMRAQHIFSKYADEGEWKVDIRINDRIVVYNV
ncbi:hypothetical protein AX17_002631 [Amanita inopinata Kibby_2008]|nr:hypothetical protein AX17_002631 [Amanita inopinata Kibby_2008]